MTTRRKAGTELLARIGSHLVIWTIVLVPTFLEMIRGWRPLIGDDSTITFRSYQILSLHPPLVGQFSSISSGSGHLLFDPGPLQYVLLAVPTHIDKLQGGLWGSALVYGLVLSVAVEAMWSLGRSLASLLVALAVVDLAWTVPSVFGHQIWNPYFGLPFLLASIALAWAVALGSFGWWPVLVFTASVAAQTELFFAIVAAGLVIVCPLIGGLLSGWPTRLRWLIVGAGVAVLSWLPTLIQEVSGSPGNLGALVSSRGEAPLGVAYGLRNLGGVAWPSPLPIRQYDAVSSYASIGSVPVVSGVVVLIAIAAIAVTAWRFGRRDLAALATIGLVCSVCVVVTFASAPKAHLGSLSWLVPMLWIVGYLLWLIVIWAVIEVMRAWTLQKLHVMGRPSPKLNTVFGVFILFGVLIVMVFAGLWKLPSQSTVNSEENAQVRNVVQTVASKIQPGAVTIKFWPTPSLPLSFLRPESFPEAMYGLAIRWQLTAAGFEPLMEPRPFFTGLSGITSAQDRSSPTVNVIMNGYQIQKVVIGTYSPPAKQPSA